MHCRTKYLSAAYSVIIFQAIRLEKTARGKTLAQAFLLWVVTLIDPLLGLIQVSCAFGVFGIR